MKMYESPFKNDPFAAAWGIYKHCHADKPCDVIVDLKTSYDKDYGRGVTFFDVGDIPLVVVFAEYPYIEMVETLIHELAHVAVGYAHAHDEVWQREFDKMWGILFEEVADV